MAATTEPLKTVEVGLDEQRVLIREVDWQAFEVILAAIGDQAVRAAYNQRDQELMAPGPRHESGKGLFDRLIEVLTEELGMPCFSLGSYTWKRSQAERAIEADECDYLTEAKLTPVARPPDDTADSPGPTWQSRSASAPARSIARRSMPRWASPRSGGSTAGACGSTTSARMEPTKSARRASSCRSDRRRSFAGSWRSIRITRRPGRGSCGPESAPRSCPASAAISPEPA